MNDIMTAKEVASYLKINERTVLKYASESKLPAVKVGGQWRFKREVLDHWLESQMKACTEPVQPVGERAVSIAEWLHPEMVLPNVETDSGQEVLSELVRVCVESGQVTDGKALLSALLRREQLCSTALGQGVAFPHVRESGLRASNQPVLALAKAPGGVDFGASDGEPTFLFFMVYAPSTKVHLRILARLSQLLRDSSLVEDLRGAQDAGALIGLLQEAEAKLDAG
jgi:nitrogen PTS system EIIA component